MENKIKQLLEQYKGHDMSYAMEFDKPGIGTLPQALTKLYEEEMAQTVRNEKDKYINELEQMILVYNNQVIMSKLTAMREKLEGEPLVSQ